MNRDEDDDSLYDETNDAEPAMQELRIEMIRLQAEIDQLAASARERASEIAELRDRMTDLELRFSSLVLRHRRRTWLWVLIAAMYGAAAGMGFSYLMRP
jgi:predicted nuclease with TOPRIM domain